jgi:hypothetical protein
MQATVFLFEGATNDEAELGFFNYIGTRQPEHVGCLASSPVLMVPSRGNESSWLGHAQMKLQGTLLRQLQRLAESRHALPPGTQVHAAMRFGSHYIMDIPGLLQGGGGRSMRIRELEDYVTRNRRALTPWMQVLSDRKLGDKPSRRPDAAAGDESTTSGPRTALESDAAEDSEKEGSKGTSPTQEAKEIDDSKQSGTPTQEAKEIDDSKQGGKKIQDSTAGQEADSAAGPEPVLYSNPRAFRSSLQKIKKQDESDKTGKTARKRKLADIASQSFMTDVSCSAAKLGSILKQLGFIEMMPNSNGQIAKGNLSWVPANLDLWQTRGSESSFSKVETVMDVLLHSNRGSGEVRIYLDPTSAKPRSAYSRPIRWVSADLALQSLDRPSQLSQFGARGRDVRLYVESRQPIEATDKYARFNSELFGSPAAESAKEPSDESEVNPGNLKESPPLSQNLGLKETSLIEIIKHDSGIRPSMFAAAGKRSHEDFGELGNTQVSIAVSPAFQMGAVRTIRCKQFKTFFLAAPSTERHDSSSMSPPRPLMNWVANVTRSITYSPEPSKTTDPSDLASGQFLYESRRCVELELELDVRGSTLDEVIMDPDWVRQVGDDFLNLGWRLADLIRRAQQEEEDALY